MKFLYHSVSAALITFTISTACADAPDTVDSFSILLEEVAKHFQRGEPRADCNELKRLIHQLVDEYARIDGDVNFFEDTEATKPFFRAVQAFFEYLDGHRLERSDLLIVREWIAESLDARAGSGNRGPPRAFALQSWDAVVKICEDCPREEGRPEPRHIVLLCLLSQPLGSLPMLGDAVVRLANGRVAVEKDYYLRLTESILSPRENPTLWGAFLDVSRALVESRTDDRYVDTFDKCADLIRVLASDADDSGEFARALDDFMRISKELLTVHRHPDYALAERYGDICLLRDAWVAVCDSGSKKDKEAYVAHVAELRAFYEGRADRVTAHWLDQLLGDPSVEKEQAK